MGVPALLTLEPTTDFALIKSVMTHPKLWPWLSDDFAGPAADFEPNRDPGLIRLKVLGDAGELLGLCITHPIHATLWEIDHALLPNAWGPTAWHIGRAFEEWLWANTKCETGVGFTPSDNRLALHYARRAGMAVSGRIPRAFQRGGLFHDIVIFTKGRP